MFVAAVPVKSLPEVKSRLHIPDRRTLALRMLTHVLHVLRASGTVEHIAVVSPDPDVLTIAASHGAVGLPQPGGPTMSAPPKVTGPHLVHDGLNEACTIAASWARDRGARGLLLAHADLLELKPSEIRDFVAVGCRASSPSIVLAPDRRGTGTNMLFATLPLAVPFVFGADSRARHREEAWRARATILEFISGGTACDIDTTQDLMEVGTLQAPYARGGSI